MSTLSSKPTKRYSHADSISVFVFVALILTLLVIPFTGNIYNTVSTALGAVDNTHARVSNAGDYSFSADQQYWTTNCSHGWSSDLTCNAIVSRAQSCSISAESAYCSEYTNYLKQFSKQQNIHQKYCENLQVPGGLGDFSYSERECLC